MKLTMATLGFRDALARVLADCSHPRDATRHYEQDPEWWNRLADDLLVDGTPMSVAVDRIRREAFEAGGSPAISVLLLELQEAEPGEYQAGLARAVHLMAQEMAQHYGSVFEAGLRVGREQVTRPPDPVRDDGSGRGGSG